MIKKVVTASAIAVAFIAMAVWIAWGNSNPETTLYTLKSERLPKAFDGFRVAQISDLHNAELDKGNQKLLALLNSAKPDIVVFTGDIVDSRRTNISKALKLVEETVKIAPCYYVTGNHESRLSTAVYGELESGLQSLGVTVLHDETALLERDGEQISLVGLDDFEFAENHYGKDNHTKEYLQNLIPENFSILLTHRPNEFALYSETGAELTLCGHVHGGQFRLPWIGGIYAPDQGLFPKYDGGLYERNGAKMAVSRGVGNSLFPFRVNNRPELVVTELRSTKTV